MLLMERPNITFDSINFCRRLKIWRQWTVAVGLVFFDGSPDAYICKGTFEDQIAAQQC